MKSLVPAPFDFKNACPEFDFLFDNADCIDNGKQTIGFMQEEPVCISYNCNSHIAAISCFHMTELYQDKILSHISEEVAHANHEIEGMKWVVSRDAYTIYLAAYLVCDD